MSESPVHKKVSELQQAYGGRLKEDIASVRRAWRSVKKATDWNGWALGAQSLVNVVHRLAGSAGMFGFPAVSRTAAPLEALLRSIIVAAQMPSSEMVTQVEAFLHALDSAASGADGRFWPQVEAIRLPETRPSTVFIVDADGALAGELAERILPFGYMARLFDDPVAALEAMQDAPPSAIIIDLDFANSPISGADLAARSSASMPVIILTAQNDFASRATAAKAGAAAYLVKPAAADELIACLNRLTRTHIDAPYDVLIVDDDELLADSYALVLALAGMTVRVVNRPEDVLETLAERRPDVILMDVYMPGCTGLTLAGIIRQDSANHGIPIIFLSIEQNFERQLAALCIGGDEFLTKPIQPDYLAAAVTSRAQRARLLRQAMETDSLTGLLNHARFKERLDSEVSRAKREGISLSLAIIDLDRFKEINDRYGHLGGDAVLKLLSQLLSRRLRKSEVISRYGGDEFAVILPDTAASTAVRVMDEARRAFADTRHIVGRQDFFATFSCGVGDLGGINDGDGMIAAADQALYAAKGSGGNRVEAASPAP
jgi:diguanylate cyclase (GGDEF)-like protein